MAFSIISTSCLCILYFKFYSCVHLSGWNYVNLHCRDNDNAPVDWWILYKPARDDVPFFETGLNFSYITPDTSGQWQPSDKYITSDSMLQHTLAPVFRPSDADSLAYIVYDKNTEDGNNVRSLSRGILLASEVTGLWIEHSIPDLVDVSNTDRPKFPYTEIANGHIAMCLSVDIEIVNAIAQHLKTVSPKIVHSKIPTKLKHMLPEWDFQKPSITYYQRSYQIYKLDFSTNGGLPVEMYVKPPENRKCLYTLFAKQKKIYLDVYGRTDKHKVTPMCGKTYGLRTIKSISIKYPEEVYYLGTKNEYMRFGVSTAASWQLQGASDPQYWVCISNLAIDDNTGVGSDLICLKDYPIWRTFDTLKVKEPDCEIN